MFIEDSNQNVVSVKKVRLNMEEPRVSCDEKVDRKLFKEVYIDQ